MSNEKQNEQPEQPEQEYSPEVQALIDAAQKEGFKPSPAFDKREFVDWNEIDTVEGLVGKPKNIASKFGPEPQTIIPVGKVMVNCSGMLSDLPMLSGSHVTIIKTGLAQTTKGVEFKTFMVLVKQN